MAKRKKRYQKKPQKQININTQALTEDSLDIVMPIHGEIDLIEKSIPSLVRAAKIVGIPTRYYFVETDSPKKIEVREYIRNFWKEGDLNEDLLSLNILNDKVGYLGGVNYGVKRGRGKYVLVTTADVVLDDMTIDRMLVRMKSEDNIAIVGPKLLFPDPCPHGTPGHIQHAGLEADIHGSLHHIFLDWDGDHPKANYSRDVFAVTGAIFLVPRYFWQQVKGFDPIYGMGTYEDADLCLTAHSLGKRVVYEPDAVATHYVAGSTKSGDSYAFPLRENEQKFRTKWQNKYPCTDWKVW